MPEKIKTPPAVAGGGHAIVDIELGQGCWPAVSGTETSFTDRLSRRIATYIYWDILSSYPLINTPSLFFLCLTRG
jgi:hypothetical protein